MESPAAVPPASLSRLTVKAYLLLTLAALAWGGNVVASRLAIGEVSPMALTCLRWAVVVGFFLGLGPGRLTAEWQILRPHWRFAMIMGAGGYTVFSAMLFVAAYFTSAVNLAILQGALPAMVFAGALVAYGTRASPVQLAGCAVTLVGILVVASRGDLDILAQLRFNMGDLLMLVGCVSYAAYTIGLRHRPKVPPMSFFFLMAAGACLSSVPLLAIETVLGKVQWPTPVGWLIIGFVGLFPSLVAQRSFMRGVELIGPGRAGLFVNLVPVFGAFLSVALLGEAFAVYHAVSLVLVLAGILLAEFSMITRPQTHRSPQS